MPPESTILAFALLIGLPPVIRLYRETQASARELRWFEIRNRIMDAKLDPGPARKVEGARPTPDQVSHAISRWHEGRNERPAPK